MLTGTIEYSAPSNDMDGFTGLIKLKTDPKKGVLTPNNLIPRYSVLKHTGWWVFLLNITIKSLKFHIFFNIFWLFYNFFFTSRIFGLVAYTGPHTKAMKNSRYSSHKNSFLARSAEAFSIFSIFVVFIFAIVKSLFFYIKNPLFYKFLNKFIKKINYYGENSRKPYEFFAFRKKLIKNQ